MNKKFIGDPGVRPGDPRVRLAAPVRAHGHHPQQPVLEPHQQLLPGRVVTAPRAVDQDLGVRWLLAHVDFVPC